VRGLVKKKREEEKKETMKRIPELLVEQVSNRFKQEAPSTNPNAINTTTQKKGKKKKV